MVTPSSMIVALLFTLSAQSNAGQMVDKQKSIFEDSFTKPALLSTWSISHGDWSIQDGVLVGSPISTENHGANIRASVPFEETGILEVEFKLSGSDQFSVSLAGKGQGRLFVVTPTVCYFRMKAGKSGEAVVFGFNRCEISTNDWHSLRIEFHEDNISASIDGKCFSVGSHPKIGEPKTNINFGFSSGKGSIDNLKFLTGTLNPDWEREENPTPHLGLAEFNFQLADSDGDDNLSKQEFRNLIKNPSIQIDDEFTKKDRNKDGQLSKQEVLGKRR